MSTLNIFCARCNSMKPFEVTVDPSGEYVADCQDCDHIIKWPGDCKLADEISRHNEANVERVLVDPETGLPRPSKSQIKQIEKALEVHSSE